MAEVNSIGFDIDCGLGIWDNFFKYSYNIVIVFFVNLKLWQVYLQFFLLLTQFDLLDLVSKRAQ